MHDASTRAARTCKGGSAMRTSLRVLSGVVAYLLLAAAASAQTTVQYDSKGRVVRVDYGGGKVMTFTYDAANNLVAETAAAPGNTLAVAVSPAGAGTVSGTGIACPADCTETYPGSPAVALTAGPGAGWVFLGWGGALAGSQNPASLTMAADYAVAAYFGAASGDTDGDGTPDTEETAGGNFALDGNFDGIPDYQQAHVVSLPSQAGNAPAGALTSPVVTLAVEPPAQLAGVAAVGNPSPGNSPPQVGFPFGFLQFQVTGVSVAGWANLDVFLPPAQLTSYWNYGPTPDNATPSWYEFVHYHPSLPGAEIWPRGSYVQVRLFLQDGAKGDHGLAADGIIAGLGAPSGQLLADIGVTPTSVSFGLIKAGMSALATVTVASTGQAPLVLGTVGSGNPLAAPFSVATDGCSGQTLAPGASCTLQVRFAPTAEGSYSDSFAIPSNAATVTVSVAGEAERPEAIPALGLPGLVVLAALLALAAGVRLGRRG